MKFAYEHSCRRRKKILTFGLDEVEIGAFRALIRYNFSDTGQKVGGLKDTLAHPLLKVGGL